MSNAPTAPPESVEARIALRQHREVTALNRFIFQGNVLEGTGDLVDHWIVMFCPSWHDKCQGLLPSFELLGVQWENKLNQNVMSSSVRFAKVDCATEKALCVSLDIDDYPSVVHYRSHRRVASWHGGAPGLVRFVKQEIEGPKRRPKTARKPKVESSCAADGAATTEKLSEAEGGHRFLAVLLRWMHSAATAWRTLFFVLALLAGARSAMLLVSRRAAPEKRCASEKRRAAPSSRLHACLPAEWARERRSIEL